MKKMILNQIVAPKIRIKTWDSKRLPPLVETCLMAEDVWCFGSVSPPKVLGGMLEFMTKSGNFRWKPVMIQSFNMVTSQNIWTNQHISQT